MNTTETIIVSAVVVAAVAVVVVALILKAKANKAAAPATTSRELQSPGLFVEGLFEGLDQAAAEVAKRTAAGFREQALSYLSKTPPPPATTDPKP